MPQASDELRELMSQRFPDPEYPSNVPDCGVIEDWLLSKGWKSCKGLMWSPLALEKMPREEFEAMMYLVHEWDYAYDGIIR